MGSYSRPSVFADTFFPPCFLAAAARAAARFALFGIADRNARLPTTRVSRDARADHDKLLTSFFGRRTIGAAGLEQPPQNSAAVFLSAAVVRVTVAFLEVSFFFEYWT